jgi:hypothetical protein
MQGSSADGDCSANVMNQQELDRQELDREMKIFFSLKLLQRQFLFSIN